MNRYQRGLTTVEFAFVGATLMILLFSLCEFSRLLYTYAALGEGTRRAARLAAVCPLGSPAITRAATQFGDLPGFRAGNLRVEYLDAGGRFSRSYNTIQYVQTRVVDYHIELLIPFVPFFDLRIAAPSFAVTLPRESLGVTPIDVGFCG
jgi:TadE-like protein